MNLKELFKSFLYSLSVLENFAFLLFDFFTSYTSLNLNDNTVDIIINPKHINIGI